MGSLRVNGGRFGGGDDGFFRGLGADCFEFLIDVLDPEIYDSGVPIWVAGLKCCKAIAGLPVFLDSGVFLPEPREVVCFCDERVGLNEGIVRSVRFGCGLESKRQNEYRD